MEEAFNLSNLMLCAFISFRTWKYPAIAHLSGSGRHIAALKIIQLLVARYRVSVYLGTWLWHARIRFREP